MKIVLNKGKLPFYFFSHQNKVDLKTKLIYWVLICHQKCWASLKNAHTLGYKAYDTMREIVNVRVFSGGKIS